MINSETGKQCGFGDHAVTEVKHFLIPMQDGIKLAAKAWFPATKEVTDGIFKDAECNLFYEPPGDCVSKDQKFAVILEYIPYRKSDFTAERDYRRHPWFSSHGYVDLRVDIRGSGESEGLYFDEYLKQEQLDCMDVMKWISAQPWSNGKVGMIGKSWGGFNGLQLAYCQPPELKAVISLYSTDDRYATDMHHDGGCIIGDGLLSWGSQMFVWNARCPDPRLVPDWKKMWLNRLENTYPWSTTWLKRQLRDEFWAHGSICEDFSRVTCPILAIGGWKDGYRDAVLRMVEHLPNVKGIIGPWPHEWPDTCKPGPNMEYLQVAMQWFDHHLRGIENNVMDEPKLRLYLQSHILPDPYVEYRHGKWIQLEGWPSKSIEPYIYKVDTHCIMSRSGSGRSTWDRVPFSMVAGMSQGIWLELGGPDGQPDQRLSDAYNLQYSTDVLAEEVAFIGNPNLTCKIKVENHNQGVLAVKLIDVFPSGESTLITYGKFNLTHADGHTVDKVKHINPGEEIEISIQLHSNSYVIPEGHCLKLCVSSCYWPGAWPSSKVVEMSILNPVLSIPTIDRSSATNYNNPLFETKNPKVGPELPVSILTEPEQKATLEIDIPRRKYKRSISLGLVKPRTLLKHLGVIIAEDCKEIYEAEEGKPLSAQAFITHEYTQEYPDFEGGMVTKVFTESKLSADKHSFYIKNKLKTTLNGKSFFEKEWQDTTERKFV